MKNRFPVVSLYWFYVNLTVAKINNNVQLGITKYCLGYDAFRVIYFKL